MHILILAAAFIVASAGSVRIVLATMSFLFMKQLFRNSGLQESVELLLEDLLVAMDNLREPKKQRVYLSRFGGKQSYLVVNKTQLTTLFISKMI